MYPGSLAQCTTEPPPPIGRLPEAVVREWYDRVWNRRESDAIAELLLPEAVFHHERLGVVGPDEYREKLFWPSIVGVPDLRISIEGLVVSGHHVAVRWRARGTHGGMLMNLPPTGRTIDISGMAWYRLDPQTLRIAESWDALNLGGVLQMLAS